MSLLWRQNHQFFGKSAIQVDKSYEEEQMSVALEDFCLIVAIADAEFNQTPNVEGEMTRILTQLKKNEEALKRINQTILVSAIYSSQQKEIKEQCKELVRNGMLNE